MQLVENCNFFNCINKVSLMRSLITVVIYFYVCFVSSMCFSQTSNDFAVTQNTNSLVGPDHTFTGFTKKLKNGRILQFFRLDPGDLGNHVGPNAGIAKRFSDDDGKTWSMPEMIYKDEFDDRIGSGGILDNGEIVVFFGRYACTSAWGGFYVDINYISSTDNGETWSNRNFIESASQSACFFDLFKIPGKTGYFASSYSSYYVDIRYSPDGHNWDSVYCKWDYRATKELNIVEPVFTPLGNGKIIGLFRVEQKAIYQTVSADDGKTWSYPEETNLANSYFCSYPFSVFDEKINKLITIVCDRRGGDYDMNNMNSGVWVYCNDPDSMFNDSKSYSNCHFVPRGNPNIFRFMGYPYAAKTNDSTYLVLYADCYKKSNNYEDADYYQFNINLSKNIYITKTEQSITINQPNPTTITEQNVDFNAYSSSGLPVDFESSNESIIAVSNGKLIPKGIGICTITVKQNGDLTYKPANPVSIDISIIKANQFIDAIIPGFLKLDDVAVDLQAKASSLLPVMLQTSDSSIAYFENEKLIVVNAGMCLITIVQNGNAIYNPVSFSKALIVSKLNQTIEFHLPPIINAGINSIELNEHSSSQLPVTITSSDSTVAFFENGKLTILSAGLCVITAYQDGNTLYNPANSVSKTIKVEKLNQIVDFKLAPAIKMDVSKISLNENASSNLPVDIEVSDSSVAIFENGELHILGAGICVITASQSGNAIYNPAKPINKVLKVEKINQVIDFTFPQTIYVGDSNITISSTASSNLPLQFSVTDSTIATITNGTLDALLEGYCIITGIQLGNYMFSSSNSISKKIFVNKREQSIATNIPSTMIFGESISNITAQASSGLAIMYESSDTTIATFEKGTLLAKNTGICTITASQLGNYKFKQATNVSIPLEVKKANQFIVWNLQSKATYLDSDIDLIASASSGLDVYFESSDTNIVQIINKKLHIVGVGDCSIKATQIGNKQYNEALSISLNFTVEKANQNIDFTTNENLTYSSDTISLQANASSLLPVSYSSSDSSIIAILKGNSFQIKKPGYCTITAIQNGNELFNPASPIEQTIHVEKASQKLAFSSLDYVEYQDTKINPIIEISSGLDVIFTSSNPSIIEIIDNKFHIVGTGQCTITANQIGNEYYFPSNTFNHNIIVEKAFQTIVFDPLKPVYCSDKQIDLIAIASSGLGVTFSSSDTTIATIKDGKVLLKKNGKIIIKANQAGNDNYLAAHQVLQLLTVLKDTIPNTIESESELFKPYPNPTNNKLTINNTANKTIKVFDLKGKVLFEQNVVENQLTIDVSSFVSGMYYIQITTLTTSTSLLFTKE